MKLSYIAGSFLALSTVAADAFADSYTFTPPVALSTGRTVWCVAQNTTGKDSKAGVSGALILQNGTGQGYVTPVSVPAQQTKYITGGSGGSGLASCAFKYKAVNPNQVKGSIVVLDANNALVFTLSASK